LSSLASKVVNGYRSRKGKEKVPSLAGEGTWEETRIPHCLKKDKPVFGLQATENGFLKEKPCTMYTEIK